MKRMIFAVFSSLMLISLSACSGGVSQDEYDKVVEEKNALSSNYEDLEREYNELLEKTKGSNALILAKETLHKIHEEINCYEIASDSCKILYVPVDAGVVEDATILGSQIGSELGNLLSDAEFDFDCLVFDFLHPLSDIPVSTLLVDCHTGKTYEQNWIE